MIKKRSSHMPMFTSTVVQNIQTALRRTRLNSQSGTGMKKAVTRKKMNLNELSRHFEICHKLARAYSAMGDQAATLSRSRFVAETISLAGSLIPERGGVSGFFRCARSR